MRPWQKAIKYVAIAFAILLTVSIAVGIIRTVSSISLFFGNDKNVEGEMQKYELDGSYSELEIEIGAAKLVIATGDDFLIESNYKYLSVKETDSKLTVGDTLERVVKTNTTATVTIYIPENATFKKADIKTGAGEVRIEALTADRISMSFGAGEVILDDLVATDKIKIDGGAGAITIRDGELNELDLDMGIGELDLTAKLTGDCELNMGVGEASVTLIGNADDYRIDIDKGLGEANVDGESVGDGFTLGRGTSRVEIDGGVGSIRVGFKK